MNNNDDVVLLKTKKKVVKPKNKSKHENDDDISKIPIKKSRSNKFDTTADVFKKQKCKPKKAKKELMKELINNKSTIENVIISTDSETLSPKIKKAKCKLKATNTKLTNGDASESLSESNFSSSEKMKRIRTKISLETKIGIIHDLENAIKDAKKITHREIAQKWGVRVHSIPQTWNKRESILQKAQIPNIQSDNVHNGNNDLFNTSTDLDDSPQKLPGETLNLIDNYNSNSFINNKPKKRIVSKKRSSDNTNTPSSYLNDNFNKQNGIKNNGNSYANGSIHSTANKKKKTKKIDSNFDDNNMSIKQHNGEILKMKFNEFKAITKNSKVPKKVTIIPETKFVLIPTEPSSKKCKQTFDHNQNGSDSNSTNCKSTLLNGFKKQNSMSSNGYILESMKINEFNRVSNGYIKSETNPPKKTIENFMKEDDSNETVLTTIELMENTLLSWIDDCTSKDLQISNDNLANKAKNIVQMYDKQLNLSKPTWFDASKQWKNAFYKRFNLNQINCLYLKKEEQFDENDLNVKRFVSEFENIIRKGSYRPEQIFNLDECGLYWKMDAANDYPDYFNLLIGCNASGDFKVKPLLIYSKEKAEALKDLDENTIPIAYTYNRDEILEPDDLDFWFKTYFLPEVRHYLQAKGIESRILLVMDSVPLHLQLMANEMYNVKIVFIPPIVSFQIQPMAQTLTQQLQSFYVKRVMKMFDGLFPSFDSTYINSYRMDFAKRFKFHHGINFLGQAWNDDISQAKLVKSWKRIYPSNPCRFEEKIIENTGNSYSHIMFIPMLHPVSNDLINFEQFYPEQVQQYLRDRKLWPKYQSLPYATLKVPDLKPIQDDLFPILNSSTFKSPLPLQQPSPSTSSNISNGNHAHSPVNSQSMLKKLKKLVGKDRFALLLQVLTISNEKVRLARQLMDLLKKAKHEFYGSAYIAEIDLNNDDVIDILSHTYETLVNEVATNRKKQS